jgi:hypothetical protein
MTLEEQLAAAKNLEALWRGLMPGTVPDHGQFLRWAAMDSEMAAYAINRSSRKVRRMVQLGTPMTADDTARYVTSVIRHEVSVNRKFNAPAHAIPAVRIATERDGVR